MNKLLEALKLLVQLHVDLLETAKRKQSLLVSGSTSQLLPVLSDESKLLKKIRQADSLRIEAVNSANDSISFSELVDKAPEGTVKDQLILLGSRLQDLFGELRQVNRLNQQLIEQSLSFTQFMIEQILPASEGPGTYSSGMNPKESNDSIRLFDAKA